MRDGTVLGSIESVQFYEEGNYSCVANGPYGSDQGNFSVTFKGKTFEINWKTILSYQTTNMQSIMESALDEIISLAFVFVSSLNSY